ncbi:hypothetical protein HJO_06480 [Hyphomonas johnsonii MHS-2]|uniref:DUF4386 domain-containing protein n=1 Tax=Hyphomonas johnsonii MHS-2 TaxID=1280950 RepID=A0A059FS46_9PROT|nr:hypothetical protein HJO_06480 [Hyphomonas johnsonii MHS-2]
MAGLAGAVMTGLGEGLIQMVPGGVFTDPAYGYFLEISRSRLMVGHFLAIASAPLYLMGYWHLTGNLLPASPKIRFIIFAVCAWAFILATVWMGQRALLAATVQAIQVGGADPDLLARQVSLHEPLVNALRIVTTAFSIVWIAVILKGVSRYPRWMALFSPAALLALIFGFYTVAPEFGWLVLPTAMNTAHAVLFILSLLNVRKASEL